MPPKRNPKILIVLHQELSSPGRVGHLLIEGGFDLDPDIYDNHEGAERAVQHCQEHGWEGDKSFVVSRLVGPWEKRP